MFLSLRGAEIILWLHVLAACVWIGGQVTLGAVVPLLRRDRTLLAAAARRFQWIAWTAFAVLVVTGLANMHNAGITQSNLTSTPAGRTLVLKLAFVLVSGLAAAAHAYLVGPRASAVSTSVARALSGALAGASLLAALVAALYGVVIAQT
jgi:putative copper export protein